MTSGPSRYLPIPRLHPLVATMALIAFGLTGCAIHPQPLTADELAQVAKNERGTMFADQEPLSGPITLDEALARAVRYNLDHRLKMMEEAMGQRQLDLSNFDLLPKLTTAAGYTTRDHVLASTSRDVFTNQQSLVPSYSADKTDRTADLGFSWNILDFGVSYYEAKEQADRVLVLEERRRKVVQMMAEQVREAYWQAVGTQQLSGRVEPLLTQARKALEDSHQVVKENLRDPMEQLTYQRELLDIMRQLELIRDLLNKAKPRLATLMNLAPGAEFKLAPPSGFEEPAVKLQPEEMELMALEKRPELVEASYNERIGVNETHKALAKLLPGIELNFGTHYDSNSLLVYNNWRDAGLRVSWNLLNVLNVKNVRGMADAQLEVARAQRLALSMAVLTQVHVARIDLDSKRSQFELMQQINDIDQQILTHTRAATEANAQGKLKEIRAATTAMMSELRVYQSYGELQSAYGQLLATVGADPLPSAVAGRDLASLKQSIAQENQHWSSALNSRGM